MDIGTGLPSADNTHEVAQRIASGTQVVYVDNDPLVLAHARTLLTSDPADTTRYIDADLREPHDIVEKAGNVLDLSQPTAVLLMGILGHIRSTAQARETIDTILSAVPSGSYLAIYDGSNIDPGAVEAERQYNETAPLPYYLRDRADFGALFEGLEPVPPGIVTCSRWCAEHDGSASTTHAPILGAVARKP